MNIKPETLYLLISEGFDNNNIDGYIVVDDTITSADAEDGGADHDLVIKHVATEKYYRFHYTDWDMENTDWDYDTQTVGGRCDLQCKGQEVEPRSKVITVYVAV